MKVGSSAVKAYSVPDFRITFKQNITDKILILAEVKMVQYMGTQVK